MITEVNIDWLLEFAMTYGKQCYLPRVNGDNIELVKYPCRLQKGAFGILEPVGEAVETNIDLCIVPVLAVDNLPLSAVISSYSDICISAARLSNDSSSVS